ncbi:MAG: MBL fold metallo-hydrolase, partial [Prevotellaceae bacterium]|nr:MBL fold metallo-hydrolase [Prevotellaceae bacterium]
IPAHAEVTKDISALIEINIEAIKKLYEDLLEICSEKQSFDSILKQVFDRYSMSMTTQQFALIGSTIKSYLSCLYSQDKIEICIEDNLMLWKKKQ